MSLPNPRISHTIHPPALDSFLHSLPNIRFGINDPDTVVRMERYGEEDWVWIWTQRRTQEDERVLARVFRRCSERGRKIVSFPGKFCEKVENDPLGALSRYF